SAYQTIREKTHLRPGQSMEIAGYTATYESVTGVNGPNYTGFRSTLSVTGHGESFSVDPGMNDYGPVIGPSNEVSIYHDPRHLGDFFANASLVTGTRDTIDLTILVKPLINLIWAGGF